MEDKIPETIWIIADEEISEPLTPTGARDARRDMGSTIANMNKPIQNAQRLARGAWYQS